MLRLFKKCRGLRFLDDLAAAHDDDTVAEAAHHREIMADEGHGEIHLRPQIHEQIEDLGLARHVEAGDDLISEDETRLERHRAGNADPLALAAG